VGRAAATKLVILFANYPMPRHRYLIFPTTILVATHRATLCEQYGSQARKGVDMNFAEITNRTDQFYPRLEGGRLQRQ
jgi:hypothetical protein